MDEINSNELKEELEAFLGETTSKISKKEQKENEYNQYKKNSSNVMEEDDHKVNEENINNNGKTKKNKKKIIDEDETDLYEDTEIKKTTKNTIHGEHEKVSAINNLSNIPDLYNEHPAAQNVFLESDDHDNDDNHHNNDEELEQEEELKKELKSRNKKKKKRSSYSSSSFSVKDHTEHLEEKSMLWNEHDSFDDIDMIHREKEEDIRNARKKRKIDQELESEIIGIVKKVKEEEHVSIEQFESMKQQLNQQMDESFWNVSKNSKEVKELKKKLQEVEKLLKRMPKIVLKDTTVLAPGFFKQPQSITDQWCLFWNDIGHITRKEIGERRMIFIYVFAGSDTDIRKFQIHKNIVCASLSKVGYALGSNPMYTLSEKSRSTISYTNFDSPLSWERVLPVNECVLGIANGNSFVAVVTSFNFLRIFSIHGYIISSTLLKGTPIAISAYENLLFFITTLQSYEDSFHFNLNNTYYCTLLKIKNMQLPNTEEGMKKMKTVEDNIYHFYDTFHMELLYEDVLCMSSCNRLNWINISKFGIPFIRDTSNYIFGLYPIFKTEKSFAYQWVPICNLNELNDEILESKKTTEGKLQEEEQERRENELEEEEEEAEEEIDDEIDTEEEIDEWKESEKEVNIQSKRKKVLGRRCNYYPLYFIEFDKICVIKLKKHQKEPFSNEVKTCLGFNVETKYIRSCETSLIPYKQFAQIVEKQPKFFFSLHGEVDDKALTFEVYDECRSRAELYRKQLCINILKDYQDDGRNEKAKKELAEVATMHDACIFKMLFLTHKETNKRCHEKDITTLFKLRKNRALGAKYVYMGTNSSNRNSTNINTCSPFKRQELKYKKKVETPTKKYITKEHQASGIPSTKLVTCPSSEVTCNTLLKKKREFYDPEDLLAMEEELREKNVGKKTKSSVYRERRGSSEFLPMHIPKDEKYLDKFFGGITKGEQLSKIFTADEKEELNNLEDLKDLDNSDFVMNAKKDLSFFATADSPMKILGATSRTPKKEKRR